MSAVKAVGPSESVVGEPQAATAKATITAIISDVFRDARIALLLLAMS